MDRSQRNVISRLDAEADSALPALIFQHHLLVDQHERFGRYADFATERVVKNGDQIDHGRREERDPAGDQQIRTDLISNSHKKIMLISAPIATPMTTDIPAELLDRLPRCNLIDPRKHGVFPPAKVTASSVNVTGRGSNRWPLGRRQSGVKGMREIFALRVGEESAKDEPPAV